MKKLPPRTLILATGIMAIALFAANSLLQAVAGSAGKPGTRFPDLAKSELEGTVPDLQGKVVLVDLWASWCGPCKRAFPILVDLHTNYAARGFTVLAVSLDEKKADMDEFLAKTKPPFPAVRDAKGKLSDALQVDSIPTSFLLGTDGRIIARHEGFEGETTRRELATKIEAALTAAGR